MLKLHQTDVASVRAAREAVGPDVELMLDTNCPWTPAEAIAMARALAPYRLFWLEEPVWPPEDYAGLARGGRSHRHADRARRERVDGCTASARSSRHRAGEILQPSITKVGGISEFKKIAALAQAANLADRAALVLLRSRASPPPCTWRPPSAAARPSSSRPASMETPFLTRPITARATAGWTCRPGPGLGVEVNEEAIRRHPFVPAAAKPFVLT